MNNTNKILGALLMISSIFISTLDRISVRISTAIVEAGYASGGKTREIIPASDNGFTGFLVYFLFFVGFVLLIAGFPGNPRKDKTNRYTQNRS
ncbi:MULTISPECIES: hypothetical protein [unclassified Paenibacillus]|uniref:hypothetical protein n=1 Tax=unclassified Paenibacillus TaxID=185978 RepID=UPI0009A612AF|nr:MULTISPECIES: hypothetical protein [unclassified Paenibacillus]SLJ96757.1 hypothetical protein SAMN06272722_102448 [Paenibacillus sp. RU5A]SOC67067.1 hypothetical protein SAMN05880581_102550 [Paenibacillus sp. RU26A]SOC69785.1 hypothetical protein SAMN05880586_102448 [Paenibacillus sp. RU5M]